MHSKGLALPRPSHFGEIALAGSRRQRSTLAAAPLLFAHAVITETSLAGACLHAHTRLFVSFMHAGDDS